MRITISAIKNNNSSTTPYKELVKTYKELESTTKRLVKIKAISELLKKLNEKKSIDEEEFRRVILLLQGRVFPPWDKRTLGVSSKLLVKAIALASGNSEQTVEKKWREIGDLGYVAKELFKKKKQSTLFQQELTIRDVFEKLRKIASLEGTGSTDHKLKIIGSLLTSADEEEVRFITRTILEELRIGVAEGTLRDAIIVAFFDKYLTLDPETGGYFSTIKQAKSLEQEEEIVLKEPISETLKEEQLGQLVKQALEREVQAAYDRSNDFSKVAITAAKEGIKGLRKIKIIIGEPIKVMLAQKEPTIKDALDRTGRPAAIEEKYDGIRMQIHKKGEEITLFTRRLENITKQFPEVIRTIKELVKDNECILDSEAIGYDSTTKKYRPFQEISQRIKRKYDIEELSKKLPVEIRVFDIIVSNGEEVINKPFQERRKILADNIIEEDKRIRLAKQIITSDEKEAEEFYKESLRLGHEGIMVKNLKTPYQPGSRVGHMIKVKPVMDSLDLVIVGAEWGEGKRSGWLTSFTVACQDHDGELLTIGKVGTGLKEKKEANEKKEDDDKVTFEQITNLLRPLITKEEGREVTIEPGVILEIAFEEIQKSPTYDSGYALRFPRVLRIREDLSLNDLTTIDEVEAAYKAQSRITR